MIFDNDYKLPARGYFRKLIGPQGYIYEWVETRPTIKSARPYQMRDMKLKPKWRIV